jgi:hypothetical protein
MAATAAIPMTSAIIMVAEFQQGVKRDFFDVFADRCPLCLEHPQAGTLQLDAGPRADIPDNYAVNLLAAERLHRLARAVGVVRIGVGNSGCLLFSVSTRRNIGAEPKWP